MCGLQTGPEEGLVRAVISPQDRYDLALIQPVPRGLAYLLDHIGAEKIHFVRIV